MVARTARRRRRQDPATAEQLRAVDRVRQRRHRHLGGPDPRGGFSRRSSTVPGRGDPDLMVSGRFRQERLQPLDLTVLGAGDRLGVGQGGQGLVAVAWQQQALHVVVQTTALGHACQHRVELGGVGLQRAGCGWTGAAGGYSVWVAPGGGWWGTGPREPIPTLNKLPVDGVMIDLEVRA